MIEPFPSRLRRATARPAPSVCFAVARILLAAAPNSSSLFPPLAAVVAVAPNEGGFGMSAKFS